jgi:hypothetical protein
MSNDGITRRDLLKIGAVGVAGGALTISGLAKMAADAGQASAAVSAAQGGAPLSDPAELALTTVANAREGSLTVAETDLRLACSPTTAPCPARWCACAAVTRCA